MKTVTLRVSIPSHSLYPSEPQDVPAHPNPVLFLDGDLIKLVDQTEAEERTFHKGGRLCNVLSFSVAVSAPSLMSKAAIAQYVQSALSFDFPPCKANAFWESDGVHVSA